MGLFSTLQQATASTDKNASSSSSSKVSASSSASSLAVPTLIQLSTAQQSPIALPKPEKTTSTNNNKGKTMTPTAAMPSWAALTYQTCILDTTSPGVDLGVWNATLLHKDFLMPPTNNSKTNSIRKLAMTIDLRASDPASIEPQITKLQQALVRYWIQHPPPENDSTKTEEVVRGGEEENTHTNQDNDDDDELMTTTLNETTSLQHLKTVQFGLAQDDTEHTTTTATEEHDAHTKMAILLCAILPSSSINKKSSPTDDKKVDDDEDEDDASYARQQTQALLQYHLRKYAQQLNCALVYVSDDDDDNNGDDANTDTNVKNNNNPLASGSVTIAQLAILWRAFALGRPIWKEAATLLELPAEMTETAESTTDPATNSSTTSLIVYGPDNYQEDLLDTVLLRNAQYPGKWDAAKESLWKILPYEDTDTAATMESNTTNHHHDTAGDQSWLTELGQSMDVVVVADEAAGNADPLATPAKTPGTKKKPSKKTAEPATPGDAAAFFESLLK